MLLLCLFLVLIMGGCGSGGHQTTTQTEAERTTSNKAISEGTTTPSSTSEGTAPPSSASEGATLSSTANPTVRLTPAQDSDVSGEAIFADVTPVGIAGVDEDNSAGVEVDLEVRNLPVQSSNELLEAHIHQGGTCSDDRAGNEGTIQYALSPVAVFANGTGTSITTISGVTVVQLFSGTPKYIDVHAEQTENETPPLISCADLS